jgi:hypothetical protein
VWRPSRFRRCPTIDADTTAQVQQGHMIVGHIVCALVERAMFPKA